jgi:hypothetical protein
MWEEIDGRMRSSCTIASSTAPRWSVPMRWSSWIAALRPPAIRATAAPPRSGSFGRHAASGHHSPGGLGPGPPPERHPRPLRGLDPLPPRTRCHRTGIPARASRHRPAPQMVTHRRQRHHRRVANPLTSTPPRMASAKPVVFGLRSVRVEGRANGEASGRGHSKVSCVALELVEAGVVNGCFLVHAPRPLIEALIRTAGRPAPGRGSCRGLVDMA